MLTAVAGGEAAAADVPQPEVGVIADVLRDIRDADGDAGEAMQCYCRLLFWPDSRGWCCDELLPELADAGHVADQLVADLQIALGAVFGGKTCTDAQIVRHRA